MFEKFNLNSFLPMRPVFIFIAMYLVIATVLRMITRRELKYAYKNFDILAKLLKTEKKNRFGTGCLVEGNYMGRHVVAKFYWGVGRNSSAGYTKETNGKGGDFL